MEHHERIVVREAPGPGIRAAVLSSCLIAALGPAIFLAYTTDTFDSADLESLVLLGAAALGAAGLVVLARRLVLTCSWVEFGSSAIVVGRGGQVRARLPIRELSEVTPLERRGGPELLLGCESGEKFVVGFGARGVREHLQERIEGAVVEACGAAAIDRIQSNRERTLRSMLRIDSWVAGACVLLAITYVVQLAVGTEKAVGAFASAGPKIWADGQVYRLITASFVHTGLSHLAKNAFVLLLAGSVVSSLVGQRLAAIVIGVSGVCAHLVVAVAGGAGVGASGMAYGACGGIGYLMCCRRGDLPLLYQYDRVLVVAVLVLGAALEILQSSALLSWAGHSAGFVAGWAIVWVGTHERTKLA